MGISYTLKHSFIEVGCILKDSNKEESDILIASLLYQNYYVKSIYAFFFKKSSRKLNKLKAKNVIKLRIQGKGGKLTYQCLISRGTS